jgi:hypothetical protein
MKPITVILLICIISTVCCKKKSKLSTTTSNLIQDSTTSQTVLPINRAEMDAYLHNQDKTSQFFSVLANKQTLVKGAKGTQLIINPSDFEYENGTPILNVDAIQIELKELLTIGDLIEANAQTVSNGTPLISYGSYYVNATANGKKLRLKKGKELLMNVGNVPNNMSLYYGQRDSLGNMNWELSENRLARRINKLQDFTILNTPKN